MALADEPDGDVLAGLMAQLDDIEVPTDVASVKDLPTSDIAMRLHSLDERLSLMGELMQPRTQEGRDLHSERAALLVEMAERGLR